ncbi:NAD(P)/FAD-dependent oxidoreductase [Planotetraspora sp. A-T 1434]|uniref:NAD(P)/FAD-dependent oxidoreductase n=1 Tax=Planotetraspora sp. A-T 1434 TaxID=2979219 RepID=UPI0021C14D94|nr:NAD(P)/FAD-dependent oxidoreductase [Planotetraspora sp. A-T 1434]MCT9931156.1 NAD(P)/FAD-dependent oxidoreductase [Planotetraspora sp. A-T 1434]
MRVGVIGAGATGLTAAYDLTLRGHEVVVLEGAQELGGLAGSLLIAGTSLERFYHHLFGTDRAIIDLIGELGLSDRLRFHATTTGIYQDGRLHDFSTPREMLRFSPLPFMDRLRFGLSSASIKAIRRGERFNDVTALDWTRRWAGRKASTVIWEPLLAGKFGDRAPEISMAWLWARVHFRTFRLGYLDGGFARLYSVLAEQVAAKGGKLEFGKKLTKITQTAANRPVRVSVEDESQYEFDRVLVTVPQPAFAKAIGADGQDSLWQNHYLGATCFVLELDRSVIPYYWLNVNDPSFPFLALVEHTQMISPSTYGGRHVLYVGNYVPREDWRFTTRPDELLKRFVPYIRQINPGFDLSWVRQWHFSRAGFAQPVVTSGYRALIPSHTTALPGVFLATMAQVYPQDRGQNYAVAMARRVVRDYFS